MAYFTASALFIKGRWSVVVPAVILAAALTFHLLAGFLIPSLLFMLRSAWKQGRKSSVIAASCLFLAIVGSTLLFFHLHNLPIRDLWYNSHAFGHGGHIRPYLADPSPGYYFDLLNLAFLLAPAWILLIPLLIFRRIRLDAVNSHLALAAAFMGFFFVAWKATLGVYPDWNMFAAAALPFTFLVMRNLPRAGLPGRRRWIIYLFVWLFMLHSYSWVVYNHLHGHAAGM
jgi:hypothetical protein